MSDVWGYWEPDKKKEPDVCTCGVKITMGKDDQPMFHSEYCDIKKNMKKEEHETKK